MNTFYNNFMHYMYMSEWVTSNDKRYEQESDPRWISIEPIFKKFTIWIIFLSQWAVKAWFIANFTIHAIWILRIRIFIPYVSLKLKIPKTKWVQQHQKQISTQWIQYIDDWVDMLDLVPTHRKSAQCSEFGPYWSSHKLYTHLWSSSHKYFIM